MKIRNTYIFSFLILLSLKNLQARDHWAEETLKSLTLEEKIGQLFISATVINPDTSNPAIEKIVNNIDKTPIDELIKKYKIGGVLYLGKTTTPKEQLHFTNNLQEISQIPLFIAQDLEWGLNMRLKNTIKFPHNMTLGAIENDNLIFQVGKEIGRQCKLIGVNFNFAPVVDVNNNPQNPIINDRSFGEDKNQVAQKATAFMLGLQEAGIISCAKHFPGHGDTNVDSHVDLPKICHDIERLKNLEFYPFKKVINAGIKSVMVAHLEVPALEKTPGVPATLSHSIVTKLLKNYANFNGLIITDALNMKGVLKNHKPGTLELKALLAGNDILLCPKDTPRAIMQIKKAIRNGILTEEELDKHVTTILHAKEYLIKNRTLKTNFENVSTKKMLSDSNVSSNLHTPYAYKLNKRLYQSAITLVCNKENALPVLQNLKNRESIACVQVGGKVGTEKEFLSTLEEYTKIKKYYLPSKIQPEVESEITKNLMLSLKEHSAIIFGIYGMNKYAHKNFGISLSVLSFIEMLATQKNKKMILVLFGNPYSLKLLDTMEHIPCIIEAYEDTPEAQIAAAEVIVGITKPKGRLPVSASEKFHAGLGLTF